MVTGASRGIGRAIAEDLAANGAKVVINYNASTGAAEEVVAAIQANGGEAMAVQADVGNFEQAQSLIKMAIDSYGHLDVLVNNAGTRPSSRAYRTMSSNSCFLRRVGSPPVI